VIGWRPAPGPLRAPSQSTKASGSWYLHGRLIFLICISNYRDTRRSYIVKWLGIIGGSNVWWAAKLIDYHLAFLFLFCKFWFSYDIYHQTLKTCILSDHHHINVSCGIIYLLEKKFTAAFQSFQQKKQNWRFLVCGISRNAAFPQMQYVWYSAFVRLLHLCWIDKQWQLEMIFRPFSRCNQSESLIWLESHHEFIIIKNFTEFHQSLFMNKDPKSKHTKSNKAKWPSKCPNLTPSFGQC